MQTTNEPTFKRRGRIGFSLLDLKTEGTCFLKVNTVGKMVTKDEREIDYADVTNLKTGEEQRMWLDGGLRGTLSAVGGVNAIAGMNLEITYRGQKDFVTEDNEKVKVNTYDVYQID